MWENARVAYEAGGHGQRELARRLGVAPSTVLRRIEVEGWVKGPDPEPSPTALAAGAGDIAAPDRSEPGATPPGEDPISRVADGRCLAALDLMAPVSLEAGLERLPERAQAPVEAALRSRMVSQRLTAEERAAERAERCENEAREHVEVDAWPRPFLRLPEYW